jgi:trimeric autotransporter adhesin
MFNRQVAGKLRSRLAVDILEDREVPAILVGLSTTDRLVTFDSAAPTTVISSVKITGVGNQDVVGIDARPANGLVYALTNTNRLYTVNTFTGVATLVSASPPAVALAGGRVGVDFNPTVDRLRVTTSGEQNLRLNPNNGAVVDGDPMTPGTQPDTALAYAAGDPGQGANPSIIDVAYDRNFQGATLTTLYGIDGSRNTLVGIGGLNGTPSPNGGQLFTLGSLNVDAGSHIGFDIAADGTAYAAFENANGAGLLRLYRINLATGAATNLGKIGGGNMQFDSLTVLPRDEIVFAATATNRLLSFRADAPDRILSVASLTGLIGTEKVTDIDFRPATGELFGFTNLNRVLRIDTATGQTTQLGPVIDNALFATGSPAGFDFNPTVDRLRLANAANDNLRFNPLTFAVVDGDGNAGNGIQGDTDLAFIATDANAGTDPNVVAAAYDRNDNDGTTATTLFGIDSMLNVFVRQGAVDGNALDVAGGGSPNGGLLTTLGGLGVNPTDLVSFDIAGAGAGGNGVALSVMQLEGETVSKLFAINTSASTTNQPQGTATLIGTIGGGELITAMAVAPPKIQFSAASYVVNEAAGTATVTVTRTGGAGFAASVLFSAFGGTATPGADYVSQTNTLISFLPGETSKRVTIQLVNDSTPEPNERVLLSLTSPTGGNTVLGTPSSSLLVIQSDE